MQNENGYMPAPIDTKDVTLSDELLALTERLAENAHENWAQLRMSQGWVYGPERNDALKTTPCMIAYDALPDSEKEYDRATAMETIRLILKMGYKILPPEKAEN